MMKYWLILALSSLMLVFLNYDLVLARVPETVERNKIATSSPRKKIQYKSPKPPNRGAPGKRGEASSRTPCFQNDLPFTALVPSMTLEGKENVWGLTSMQQPTFLFYLPFAPTCSVARFILQDDKGKMIYQTSVEVPEKPGIVEVKLPSNIALQDQAIYQWFFRVRVTEKPRTVADIYFLNGWIQKTSLKPEIIQRIESSSPQEKSYLYAENQIWYDALSELAQLRAVQGKDETILEDWKSLLEAVGLDAFAKQPIYRVKDGSLSRQST
jgi:hypothetical protein